MSIYSYSQSIARPICPVTMRLTSLLLASLIAAFAASPARAQLRLADALRAAGDRSARDAQAIAPLHGILPSARVEASIVRTDDPVGAFGTELRQRRIAQADFDPSRLNFPALTRSEEHTA